MYKPTTTCPYTVLAAKTIWLEGLRAGLKLAMKYTGSKREPPKIGKHVEVKFIEHDTTLDCMSDLLKRSPNPDIKDEETEDDQDFSP